MFGTTLRTEEFTKWSKKVEEQVAELNAVLGYNKTDQYKVSFGYLGNDDDIAYSVFLPHISVGTYDDRFGSVELNDVNGMRHLYSQTRMFIKAVKFTQSTNYVLTTARNNY